MTEQLPEHVRPLAFGMVGLMRDLVAFLKAIYGDDLETALIMVCVTYATMQAFMADAEPDAEVLRMRVPPESVRGSISRRMIADKTGLPRETVRRKVAALIERGQLYIDEAGSIRPTPRLHEPDVQVAVSSAHDAVTRYLGTVSSYGVD
jgi:hypothetical protein